MEIIKEIAKGTNGSKIELNKALKINVAVCEALLFINSPASP